MKKILLIVALLALFLCGCAAKNEGFMYYSEAISGTHDGEEIVCQAYVYRTFYEPFDLYEEVDLLEVWFDNGDDAPVPVEIFVSRDLRTDPDVEYVVGDVLRITSTAENDRFPYGGVTAVQKVESKQTLEKIQKKYRKSCQELTELSALNNVKMKGTVSDTGSIFELIPDNMPDCKIDVFAVAEGKESLSIGGTVTVYGDMYISDDGDASFSCYILDVESKKE